MSKDEYIEKYGEEAYLTKQNALNDCADQKSRDCVHSRDYYYNHKEHYQEVRKAYYQNNKERLKEYSRRYYEENRKGTPEKIIDNRERMRKYASEHKDILSARMKKYNSTVHGRAKMLVHSYQRQDMLSGRGETTLTEQWIIDNVFSKQCVCCGETDYHKLGVKRIDKSLPYTEENVVVCCKKCNKKK